MADKFILSQYLAIGAVGIAVDDVLVSVGDRDGVAGGVVVVDVKLVGGGVDKGHYAQAVDVVAGDGACAVSFCQQVATGAVDVFGSGAIALGAQAVADTVVVVGVALPTTVVGHQAVGAIEVVVNIAVATDPFRLAFIVVAVRVRTHPAAAEQAVFGGVIAVALCAVDQGGGQDGFVVDNSLCAVAVGIEAKVIVHQGLAAAGAVIELRN